jgi:eukaryotic-like serine/threonine-protein kinase
MLLFLITNKGGSQAADTADKLLEQPDVLARGSKAMQVAYLVRKAPCEKKRELFARCGEDGDKRAYGELKIISKNSCGRRRNICCYENDKALQAAMEKIEARSSK